MNQKQIEQLKKDQKQLRDGSAARRAMAVLLFVGKGDVSFSGYTVDHAKRLKGQYLKHGIEAFKDRRTSQRDRVLTKTERQQVVTTLQTKQTHGRSQLMRAWHDTGSVILCEDEMVLTSATTMQKIWLPQGSYPPVMETNGTRKRRSFYGFYNLKTGAEHSFITEWQNMYTPHNLLFAPNPLN